MQKYFLSVPQTPEEFSVYYGFRWQQLREPLNLPLGSEQDDGEDTAYHCMAMTPRQKVVGVGRINQEGRNIMRIRYMAVDECMRGMGLGSAIITRLLNYAVQHNAELCWLNARDKACSFYQKHGFEIVEETETGLNIPHFRMEKRLN